MLNNNGGQQFYSTTQAGGDIESFESRVSTFSITDQVNSSSVLPDCQGLDKNREGNEMNPVIGFMSQQMDRHEGCGTELHQHSREENDVMRCLMSQQVAETEECNAVPQSTGVVNDENMGFDSQQIYEFEDCKTRLPQYVCVEDNEMSGFMSPLMAEIEVCDTKFLPQNADMGNDENDENSCFVGQKMANHEECDAKLSQCTKKEHNEKRGSMSQGVQQVARSEECVSKSPQHMRKDNDEKSGFVIQQMAKTEDSDIILQQHSVNKSDVNIESSTVHLERGKYFYYDPPLSEETGVWIPVSVPPMSESEREEWIRGFCSNGGTFPEGDMGWGELFAKDKELTMWDVVVEMLLVARGKVNAFASGDICKLSWMSNNIIEQAWKEMAQTLTETKFGNTQKILETEPPKWLPDSSASACMLCSVRFHPIMCTRHHCRFCGGIFCSECTKGRSLLPEKFLVADPQRVCDVCCVRLETVQQYLMDQVSRAAQLPTHDLTDLSTLRSWLNFPWGQSMESEIYKATNSIHGYNQVGFLRSEKSIPDAILRKAKGLAILTVMKVGVMVTYNIGTGLVVARREDGSWSPPSAISSLGVGWGAQAGGEFTDFIIVLRSNDAVKTFSGDVHLSVGAGLSAAAGIVGRTAEADVRAGTGGYAACYTYSCSKGAFVGCSLEGSIVTTRGKENSRFYGSQSLTASDILLGSLPRPPAAATLYRALANLYQKFDV